MNLDKYICHGFVKTEKQKTRRAMKRLMSARRLRKILLFGLGVVLPLGSLIWDLLILHGRSLAPSTPAPDDS